MEGEESILAKNLAFSFLLDFYGEMLTEKQREAIEYYYNEDLSLSEIAQNQGITRQGVRDAIKRAESLLYEMEERLGLARRFHKMHDGLEMILESAQKIKEYNNNIVCSKELQDQVTIIEETVQKLFE